MQAPDEVQEVKRTKGKETQGEKAEDRKKTYGIHSHVESMQVVWILFFINVAKVLL